MPDDPTDVSSDRADPQLLALLGAQVLPVLGPTGFVFNSSFRGTDQDGRLVDTVLYEAPPEPFTSTYPELSSDYGDQPVPCIDLWIRRDVVGGSLDADLEGVAVGGWCTAHDRPDLVLGLFGAAGVHAAVTALADALALMLHR